MKCNLSTSGKTCSQILNLDNLNDFNSKIILRFYSQSECLLYPLQCENLLAHNSRGNSTVSPPYRDKMLSRGNSTVNPPHRDTMLIEEIVFPPYRDTASVSAQSRKYYLPCIVIRLLSQLSRANSIFFVQYCDAASVSAQSRK
jgi:hypothetical protein